MADQLLPRQRVLQQRQCAAPQNIILPQYDDAIALGSQRYQAPGIMLNGLGLPARLWPIRVSTWVTVPIITECFYHGASLRNICINQIAPQAILAHKWQVQRDQRLVNRSFNLSRSQRRWPLSTFKADAAQRTILPCVHSMRANEEEAAAHDAGKRNRRLAFVQMHPPAIGTTDGLLSSITMLPPRAAALADPIAFLRAVLPRSLRVPCIAHLARIAIKDPATRLADTFFAAALAPIRMALSRHAHLMCQVGACTATVAAAATPDLSQQGGEGRLTPFTAAIDNSSHSQLYRMWAF